MKEKKQKNKKEKREIQNTIEQIKNKRTNEIKINNDNEKQNLIVRVKE